MPAPLTVLDRIALLAVVTDADGYVSYVNPATRDLAEIPLGEKFSPIARPSNMRVVKSISGATNRFTTASRKEGQTRLFEWTTSPLDDGEILYTGQDVTRDRRSLRALRDMARTANDASQSKMRFLATMSHEMRTPLNGILGMAGLMLDTKLDGNQRTYAEAVRESGQALLALINDILDFSKIEAGKLDLEEQVIDIRVLAQSVAELLSPRAAQKGLEISSFVGSDVPARIIGDEARIRQVLLNLAGNGVKFTETGGVSLSIRNVPRADPSSTCQLEFSVSDTGIGISPHDRNRIFEEFAQADDTRSRNHEGTGLGLSIAKKLVRAMSGELDLDSTVGDGSTFRFTLNLPIRSNAPAPSTLSDLPENILVASDHQFLRSTIVAQLKELGIKTIYEADSVPAARRILEQHPNSVFLCDLKIAAEGGDRLATLSPNAIVLLSPMARGRLESFKRAGFDGYLIKPIRQVSLVERLIGDCTNANSSANRLDTRERSHTEGDMTKLRILLAEDNQINAVLATAIVKRAGHHIDVAGNGKEAIEAFELAHYDLVLMDMRMPEMDGLQATKELRLRGHTDVPIIALTANAMNADKEACREAGMDEFLSKPFDPDDLVALINKLVLERGQDPSEIASA